MEIMAKTRVRLRVSELLKERGWGPMDLVRRPEFAFAPATAYRLARDEGEKISLDVLERLCDGFEVGPDQIVVTVEESG